MLDSHLSALIQSYPMKHTSALLIVTSDDFPISTNADMACEKLVKDARTGEHRYGGKHYTGHHVVMRKWMVAKSLPAQKAINALIQPVSLFGS